VQKNNNTVDTSVLTYKFINKTQYIFDFTHFKAFRLFILPENN